MEWTDGVAKALRKLATEIDKVEKGRHEPTEDYYSDPRVYVMDMDTGAAVLIETEEHEGGKTHGRGYRRCPQVSQRIAAKMPQKKVMGRLLSMCIRNFVPEDTDPAIYSRVVNKAIDDIAEMLADDSKWTVEDDKFSAALDSAIKSLMDLTLSTRAGDTLLNVSITPIETAMMDTSAIMENKKELVQ